jgi:CRISPR system Cascade subunit CasC
MNNRLYVDIHILHTVPPSNLNRDDAGSPKHALYGGVRRARGSSQAWKRAARIAFQEKLPAADLATRTKKIAALLTSRLGEKFDLSPEQAGRVATALLAPLGIKAAQKKAQETAYLLFFGRPQLDAIIGLIADRVPELVALDDKELEAATKNLPITEQLKTGHPVDVALFGRMVADIPSLNVDAATQVAHALSTHAVDIEFDYYTAVDDENTREETGAGMIGTVEFNSATLYRYAAIGVHQLLNNLSDATAAADAVSLFLDTFTRSMPTGHQNSFAHRTLPSAVVVALRTDQPINLVSAFEKPVLPGRSGIAEEAAERVRDAVATWLTDGAVR